MRDFGKISWQSEEKPSKKKGSTSDRESQIQTLIELCSKCISSKTLLKSCDTLVAERSHLQEMYSAIIEKIAPLPFLSAFIIWSKEVACLHKEMMQSSKTLIENGFVGTTDNK